MKPYTLLRAWKMSADFVKGNEKYVAEFGDKGSISIVPAKKLTIGASAGPPRIYCFHSRCPDSDMHGYTT